MEFETPTLNSIQVLYIEVRTYPKDGSRPFYPTQRYDENFCRQWISYAQTRQNWQTIPSGFYYKTFQINDHYNSEYKSEIFIKMKGFQKKELQNQCECNDYPKWDWGKNCSNILGKKVCLGGWSWGLDKFCDQEYKVSFTINSNTKPYTSHYSGQQVSENGRYGANFSYHITAPPTLAPKPGTIDLPNSYNFLGTDAKITQETVCTGEPLSL
ncbi:MAG TPA: hypothetical protein VIK89_06495, partial [Cytophagaceae bacterium]